MHNTNIELQNSHPLHHQLLHQDRMSTQDLLYISVDASRLQTSCYKTSRYQQSIDNTQCTIQTLSFKTHIPPPPTHLWISNTTYHSIIPRPIYVSCLHLNHFTVPYSLPSLPCRPVPPCLFSPCTTHCPYHKRVCADSSLPAAVNERRSCYYITTYKY